ncbi:MAG: O-antigen ligase family protein [Acidobacteriota bacterium]
MRENDRLGANAVEIAIVVVVAIGATLIPLTASRTTLDSFRLPKELAFRAEAITLLVLAVWWALSKRRSWHFEWRRAEMTLPLIIIAWSALTALTSTNRALSAGSLLTIVAAAVIFIATMAAAQSVRIVIVDVVMIACCVNAIVVMLQEAKIWNPFKFGEEATAHLSSTAFIGNPNDVGTFLLVPALAAATMVVVTRGARRWIYAAATVVLLGGIVASATRTAIIAYGLSVLVLAFGRSWRAALAIVALVVVIVFIATSSRTTLGRSLRTLPQAAREGRYDVLFSERLPLFLSAIEMVRDHPLVGVGPGCFAFHHMRYRLKIQREYPPQWTKGWPQNASQTHNDHLQIAAEEGLPGYALFLGALGVGLAAAQRARRRDREEDDRRLEAAFARVFLPPFVAGVAVLALAQFPLEIAAPRLMLLTFGGLCVRWSRPNA